MFTVASLPPGAERYLRRYSPADLEPLSPADLLLLRTLVTGRTRRSAAALLGGSDWLIATRLHNFKRKTGVALRGVPAFAFETNLETPAWTGAGLRNVAAQLTLAHPASHLHPAAAPDFPGPHQPARQWPHTFASVLDTLDEPGLQMLVLTAYGLTGAELSDLYGVSTHAVQYRRSKVTSQLAMPSSHLAPMAYDLGLIVPRWMQQHRVRVAPASGIAHTAC